MLLMKSDDWRRISAAFDALCDLAPADRRRGLDELAAGDPASAAELEAMLAADALAEGALAAGPLGLQSATDEAESEESESGGLAPGVRLGPWRIEDRLGAGGMGEVWAAERADGTFEQRVAVKLLRRGLETDSLLRRFALERRILARLVHPGIARLVDAGSSPDGRPYFVMEHVQGRPITDWARARDLAVEARLELVLATCAAVDFAHRNLVVHRDLKPSNVLVTGAGEVKLLDFGIAKLLEPEAGSEVTELEGRALTPTYAAPEQIRGEPVTTATDVYALGVLLYEILTEKLPHRRARRPLSELASELERETIERPSNAARSVAGARARRLAGDLDNIVVKALAREPERRYPSAAALADDLRRHLEGRPVSARPDTLGYRLGKFARRNRLGVGAAALVVLSLLAGLAGTAWQARRAAENAGRAERVKRFLVDVFRQADPTLAQGREWSVREALERGAANLGDELTSDPALQADLDEALAEIHRSLGLPDRAAELAERALATREGRLQRDEVAIAVSRALLGNVRLAQARPLEARALLEPAHAALRQRLGEDALEVAAIDGPLAHTVAEEDPERALALRRHAVQVRAARLGPEHLDTAIARAELAEMLDIVDRFDEAEPLYREALRGFELRLGPLDPRVARVRVQLAGLLDRMSRPSEAEPLFLTAIEVQRRVLGERHPELGDTYYYYADLLSRSERYSEAQAGYEAALEIFEVPSLDRAYALRELAINLVELGRHDEAAARFEEAIALFREFAGGEHPETWRAVAFLGVAKMGLGRLEEAEGDLVRAVAALERTAGPSSYQIRGPLRFLAEVVRRRGRSVESIGLERRVRTIEVGLFGTADHRDVAATDRRLGIALTEVGGADALAEARLALDRAVAFDRVHRAGLVALGESLLASARLRLRTGDEPARRRAELEEAARIFATRLEPGSTLRREVAAELGRSGDG